MKLLLRWVLEAVAKVLAMILIKATINMILSIFTRQEQHHAA